MPPRWGIDEVQASLLPAEKLAAIQAPQSRLGLTAMAGDGINDAPALAQADIGVAMGGAGTHTAMEAADVVIMNDDLRRLPETIRLSRATHRVLWQNIVLALGIKAVFLVLAVFDNATMWMAVFADMGASLLVVFNGLRLLRGTGLAAERGMNLQRRNSRWRSCRLIAVNSASARVSWTPAAAQALRQSRSNTGAR